MERLRSYVALCLIVLASCVSPPTGGPAGCFYFDFRIMEPEGLDQFDVHGGGWRIGATPDRGCALSYAGVAGHLLYKGVFTDGSSLLLSTLLSFPRVTPDGYAGVVWTESDYDRVAVVLSSSRLDGRVVRIPLAGRRSEELFAFAVPNHVTCKLERYTGLQVEVRLGELTVLVDGEDVLTVPYEKSWAFTRAGLIVGSETDLLVSCLRLGERVVN